MLKIQFNFSNGLSQLVMLPYGNVKAAVEWARKQAEHRDTEDFTIYYGDRKLHSETINQKELA